MDFNFLPERIRNAVKRSDIRSARGIRLRVGFPIIVDLYDGSAFLTETGLFPNANGALVFSDADLIETMAALTENSVYAYNEQLKQGFISYKNGVRVGLGGHCVLDRGKIVTMKNISSLNVRIPRFAEGCAKGLCEKLFEKRVENILIVSPPCQGKTTMLKDIALWLNKTGYSVLIVDERGEFESVKGARIDKITYSDKQYAFTCGIRALSPDVAVTDELSHSDDWKCVKNASLCGIKVMASCHGYDIEDIKRKENFMNGVFERYVILEESGIPGRIKKILDEDFKEIC